ncbi:O-methyltransferase [Flagellimonas sp. S174]|uniref:O-methyltransferase n=1 Tax=Flagellimonas sp. S174 TaxID=3410790 RepID=UPI003BF61EBE
MEKIQDTKIQSVLNRMHKEANSQGLTLIKGLTKGIFRKLQPEDMKDAYIAISKSQGEMLYNLLLENQTKRIVEFGTSFGISTMYLGAAAKANHGKVITTELLPEKAEIAQNNFKEAELEEWVEVRVGDAMKTLQDVNDGIEFLLLDGWNDLYLPLVKLLEPKFKKGMLIYTDNASFKSARPFLEYLKANPEKYRTKRLKDDKGGSELTEYISSN